MRFSTGEPVPWFNADTHTTPSFQFSASGGRFVVLSFLGSAGRSDARQIVADVEAARNTFDDERVCFFGVTIDSEDLKQGRICELLPGIRYFQDFSGAISAAYGVIPQGMTRINAQLDYRPMSLILDQRLRVLHWLPVENGGIGHVEKILQLTRDLPRPTGVKIAEVQAPVLMVPRIFEPGFCELLMNYYRAAGNEDSGFMRDLGGKTVGIYDYSTKRRRDCIIEDEAVRKQCMYKIHDRLAPEIRRAFQFNATRMERYIVACYEGETGGHFKAHRDNSTKGTAHRRFAVTLNLNSDYDGGYLWFPEFGQQLFKPPAGGACVFSCSLLHEATPVKRGTRYVFLPFLYDDAAARTREESAQYLGGDIVPRPASTSE